MLYKDWLNIWLNNYVKSTAKIQTYNRYLKICELHIIPDLGDIDLYNLSIVDLQLFIAELLKNGNHKTGKGLYANFVNIVNLHTIIATIIPFCITLTPTFQGNL